MSFNMQDWYDSLTTKDVVYSYKGEISSELITGSLEAIETQLTEDGIASKLVRKVYNVLVESLQNLFHHSIGDVQHLNGISDNFGSFIVSKREGVFSIICGNYVLNAKVQILKDRINQINSMSKEEVKSLYKLILNNQEFSEKGGGGLGMIDISKRTENPLGFEFYQVDEKHSFFQLNISF